MKTDRAEASAITDIVKRIAIAFPHIRFSLAGTDRTSLEMPATGTGADATLERIGQVLGREFGENSLAIDAERDGVRLAGFVGIPSYNRGNALHQFAYVNGRPVRDKQIFGALRGPTPMSSPATVIRSPFCFDTRPRFGGRQCASRQSRCALPRPWIGARIDCRGDQTGAGAIGYPSRDQRRGSHAAGISCGRFSAAIASRSRPPAVMHPPVGDLHQRPHRGRMVAANSPPGPPPLDLGSAFRENEQADLAAVRVLAADTRATAEEAPTELQQNRSVPLVPRYMPIISYHRRKTASSSSTSTQPMSVWFMKH